MKRGEALDYEALFRAFDAPVTAFDCGQLCAPKNGGVPVCCESQSAIPVLYEKELKFLNKRSDHWRPFQPTCSAERELAGQLSDGLVMAVCKGAAFCERQNRSLNCRSFPFMPYLDHEGEVVGLVPDLAAAEGKCPLVEMPQVATALYVEQAVAFWTALLDTEDDEYDFYFEQSADLRRRNRRKSGFIDVLVVSGLCRYPSRLKDWKAITSGRAQIETIPYLRS